MSEKTAQSRRLTFTIIVWSLPVLILACVEFGLRLGGYGTEWPLFVPNPQQPGYLQANPEVVKRFFSDPDAAPSVKIETGFFKTERSSNSIRVFVQGGSSAAGFPYGLGASPAGMLDRRLKRAYPDREVEVISTAMAAVNSYALLDFADEIIAQDPDAVVIYAGHNEFLGVLGVGSAMVGGGRPTTTRLQLKLKSSRLYQLMENVIGAFRDKAPPTGQGASLMAAVAGERSIPLGSTLYERGVGQFEGNLERIVDKYRSAGVPVFVGTLAGNDRDQVPLNYTSTPVAKRGETDTKLAAVESALERGDYLEAGALLDDIGETRFDAAVQFYRARSLETAGGIDDARAAYRAARDADPLRFRAPERFNEIVESYRGTEGVHVVDVAGAFRAASPTGVVGAELMLEHLHPNLDGYFLMAETYYTALVDSGVFGAPTVAVSTAEARADAPVSELDRLLGGYKVARITADWPFVPESVDAVIPEPRTVPERLATQLYRQQINWLKATDELKRHYRTIGDRDEYLRCVLILADAIPFYPEAQYEAGSALGRVNRRREALNYLYRASRLSPNNTRYLLALAASFKDQDRAGDARRVLERVLAIDPNNIGAREQLSNLN